MNHFCREAKINPVQAPPPDQHAKSVPLQQFQELERKSTEKTRTLEREKTLIMAEFMEASKQMTIEHDNNIQRIEFELEEAKAERLEKEEAIRRLEEEYNALKKKNQEMKNEITRLEAENYQATALTPVEFRTGNKLPEVPAIKVSSTRSKLGTLKKKRTLAKKKVPSGSTGKSTPR